MLCAACDDPGKKDRNRSNLLYMLIAGSSETASAASIYIDGGTVYTGGSYNDGYKNNPCYWTGTARTVLPVGLLHSSRVTSIFVSGGRVYTGGAYFNDSV